MAEIDQQRFLELLLAGARHDALAYAVCVLEERGARYLYEDIITPSLHEIGRRWEVAAIGVAEEHVATAMVQDAVAAILPRFAWTKGGPRAMVGCVEGERHDVAARMLTDMLALDGWGEVFLGGDVPTSDFVEKARSLEPRLIAVSATMAERLPELARLIASLRRVSPESKLLVGGSAVAELGDASRVGADALAPTCAHGVELAAAWRDEPLLTEATVPVASRIAPRDELSLIVAHDLRQPVNTITMAANLLLDLQSTIVPPSDVRVIERIRGAAQRLNRMIDDLANTALIESGRLLLKPQPVDLAALVESIAESHPAAHDEHLIELRTAGHELAWADPDRIQQVLENLLSNAEKYGAKHAPIRIEVLAHPDTLEVVVKNRGTVVPPDQLALLFEKFTRSRTARESGQPGLGLGLYIAKQFVEAHRGRIWAESTPDGETSFHFTLPRAGRAEQVNPAP